MVKTSNIIDRIRLCDKLSTGILNDNKNPDWVARPLRLLYNIITPSFNGAFVHTVDLCEALAYYGVHVLVAYPEIYSQKKNDLVTKLCHRLSICAKCTIYDAMENRGMNVQKWLYSIGQHFNPDICLSYTNLPNITRILKIACPNMCIFQQIHNSSHWHNMRLAKKNNKSIDGCICVSENIRSSLVNAYGLNPTAVKTIWNGINIERLVPSETRTETRTRWGFSDDDFLIGYVGRLSPEKGFSDLIDAVQMLDNVPIKIVVAGSGPEMKILQEYQTKNKHKNKIYHIGLQANVGNVYQALDALALPSKEEGLPLVIPEAMLSRVPVITKPVGGVPEIISNGRTGLLANSNKEFAAAMRLIYENSALRNKLAKNAYKFAKMYLTSQRMAQEYLEYFYSSVQNKRLGLHEKLFIR
ncbi:MAG: glycosyltransferase family 4 protein [Sedimentisphaerales bacterium]|nr:glycosyltransferase family 4 protein [Sedimentisphaerales bacterium]